MDWPLGIWGRLADWMGSDHRDGRLAYYSADIASKEDGGRDAIPSAFCTSISYSRAMRMWSDGTNVVAITGRPAVIQCTV